MKAVIIILYSSLILFLGCKPDLNVGHGKIIPPPTRNTIVLLDLSDRITNSGQIARDTDIILRLYNVFLETQKKNLYFNSKDKFRVVIAKQENQFQENELLALQNKLKVDMENVPISQKVKIKKSTPEFMNLVKEVYEKALLLGTSASHFPGADIQGYFMEGFPNDYVKNAENYLFVITDGYQYVKGAPYKKIDNWVNVVDLNGTNVMVMEMDPVKGDLINMTNAWSKWLQKMNAGKFETINKTAISNLETKIRSLIPTITDIGSKPGIVKNTTIQTHNQSPANKIWYNQQERKLLALKNGTDDLYCTTEITNLLIELSSYQGTTISQDKMEELEGQFSSVASNCQVK
jgi:hypothetical protein